MANGDQVRLQNVVQSISAVFSVTINTFLIVLIATKSPKQLGAYKYLMMCISIHEIGYSVIEVVVSPMFHSYGATFLMIVITENRVLTPSLLLILHAIYCGFFAFSLAMFALHFIYRFLVATGNKRLLATFNSWKFFVWLGGPVSYGVIWSLETYYFLRATDETTEYVKNHIFEVFGLKTDGFVYSAASLYEKRPNGRYIFHVFPLIGVLTMLFFVISSLCTVVIFGVKCYFRINALVSKSTTSGKAQLLQSQLFYALVIQSLIPIILMHCPVGLTFIFTFLGWNIGNLSEILSVTIAMYPAIDPLPTIFMVKHYREGALEWTRCRRSENSKKYENAATNSIDLGQKRL